MKSDAGSRFFLPLESALGQFGGALGRADRELLFNRGRPLVVVLLLQGLNVLGGRSLVLREYGNWQRRDDESDEEPGSDHGVEPRSGGAVVMGESIRRG